MEPYYKKYFILADRKAKADLEALACGMATELGGYVWRRTWVTMMPSSRSIQYADFLLITPCDEESQFEDHEFLSSSMLLVSEREILIGSGVLRKHDVLSQAEAPGIVLDVKFSIDINSVVSESMQTMRTLLFAPWTERDAVV